MTAPRKRRARKQWSLEEIQLAASLQASGITNARIGAQLGRSAKAVQDKLGKLSERSNPRTAVSPHIRPAQELLADRDARALAACDRDLTATFFGDPPTGWSALDRRT